MLARQQSLDPGLSQNGSEELGGDVALQQPVPVLGKRRMLPGRIVDTEADEPAEQQVEVEALHQLALRPNRVERL